MKKLMLIMAFMMVCAGVFSQNNQVLFHEDFELPSLGDSVNAGLWVVTNTLAASGTHAITRQVMQGAVVDLITLPASTMGFNNLRLVFDHVCKIDFLDGAKVMVSRDSGVNWDTLTHAQYLGNGNFSGSFGCATYGALWQPSNPAATPLPSWFRQEVFNLDSFVNVNSLQVRFALIDAGLPGPSSNYGWIIDNIKLVSDTSNFSNLTGVVSYQNMQNTPMKNTWVKLYHNNVLMKQVLTNQAGQYSMSVPSGPNYQIKTETNKTWGGANALDALRIMKHFTGMTLLTGLALQSCDVDLSGNVNLADALMVLQRFSGLIPGFPANDWISEQPIITLTPGSNVVNVKMISAGDVDGTDIPQ